MRPPLALAALLACAPLSAADLTLPNVTFHKTAVDDPRIGIHSFIQPWLDDELKASLFAAAAETGKTTLRLNFNMNVKRDALDRLHARAASFKILGVLSGVPDDATCEQYAAFAGQAAARYKDVLSWELVNEPNLAFKDDPGKYRCLLINASAAIKTANPSATIVFGGVADDPARPYEGWLARVLEDPAARRAFDVGAVHVRGSVERVAAAVAKAAGLFGKPVWVTEHGFPSSPKAQRRWDERYATGPAGQASYLKVSVPAMLAAGAKVVFVTLRDEDSSDRPECGASPNASPFCTEGLVTLPSAEHKPAFAAFAAMTGDSRIVDR